MEYLKAKSAAKSVTPRGSKLEHLVLSTMSVIATIVGGTLGPGGHPVLIERPEFGLPPIITKDGVTVFKSLGFQDPVQHCIMEAARDASVRTAAEAGDGTTTATILAHAFVDRTTAFCKANPGTSPHRIIQEVQETFRNVLCPEIDRLTLHGDLESDTGRATLRAVACISSNGDEALADAVMTCFGICGDDGNVTISEASEGNSPYPVTKVEGFPVPNGYENSCGKFYPVFINDQEKQRSLVERPVFVLYFGRVTEIQSAVPLFQKLQEAWSGQYLKTPNIVFVAEGFSEAVVAQLAMFWSTPTNINVLPLVVPSSPIPNGHRHFLDDLAAITGAKVLDPVTATLSEAEFEDLGNIALDLDNVWKTQGVTAVECGRYRTTILGHCDDDLVLDRADQIRGMLQNAGSELDASFLAERLAKLTGGIAELKVVGSSNGELKERRDRAEDAVCAVRGALKHGALLGGGWTLLRLASVLPDTAVSRDIIRPALEAPVRVLFANVGLVGDEVEHTLAKLKGFVTSSDAQVYNARTRTWVNGHEAGILDSTPAVREALKNSISIATLLGTLGGTVVQPRDMAFERKEAVEAADFDRMSGYNPADERG